MNRTRVDLLFRLLTVFLVDVLNPMLVVALALFVSVGYILTLLMSVTIAHWQTLFWLSLCVPLTGLIGRAKIVWRGGGYSRSRFSWRVLLPFVPLLIFAPMFTAELAAPYLQILHHGDIHLGYIHQLLYGATPIDNIFVPGYPANFYWLYHAILAAVVGVTGLAPPLVASIVTILVILSSLFWLARILVVLELATSRSFLLGLLVVLVYSAVNITGVLTLLSTILDGSFVPDSLRIMLLPGADRRLHSVMGKVMNFTSTSVGILCFIVAFYACVCFLLGKLDRLGLITLSGCIVVCVAVRPTAALYIVVVLSGGMAVTGLLSSISIRPTETRPLTLVQDAIGRFHPGFVILWLVASACLALPLLHYYAMFSASNQLGLSVSIFNDYNISIIAAAMLVVLPLFVLQTVFALRRRNLLEYFVQVSGMLGIVTTSVLELPDNGQYKTIYYLSILMAISALMALNTAVQSGKTAWSKAARLLTIVAVVLVFAQIAFVTQVYDHKSSQWNFQYEETHVLYRGERLSAGHLEALYWIRDHSPVDSIVIIPLNLHKFTHLIHERQTYVRPAQVWYANNIPSYNERVEHVSRLYANGNKIDDFGSLVNEMRSELPGRELYAVIREDEVSGKTMIANGAKQVFGNQGGGAHVYLLNPTAVQ